MLKPELQSYSRTNVWAGDEGKEYIRCQLSSWWHFTNCFNLAWPVLPSSSLGLNRFFLLYKVVVWPLNKIWVWLLHHLVYMMKLAYYLGWWVAACRLFIQSGDWLKWWGGFFSCGLEVCCICRAVDLELHLLPFVPQRSNVRWVVTALLTSHSLFKHQLALNHPLPRLFSLSHSHIHTQ